MEKMDILVSVISSREEQLQAADERKIIKQADVRMTGQVKRALTAGMALAPSAVLQ